VKQESRGWSPQLRARVAGVFYLLAVLSAVLVEAFVRGRSLYVAGLIPIICFALVTLLLFRITRPVNQGMAWLAAMFNLISLTFEALELHPMGANAALLFHGLYCLTIGVLVLRANLLPKILGILMALAGLAWATDLSIPVTNHLAPYNLIVGFSGEGLFMLWLLAFGVNVQRWTANEP
jgi:hypothetical protein